MRKSTSFSLIVALLAISSATQLTPQNAFAAPAVKDYTNGVRIGGWLGDRALIVLPDRSASPVSIGNSFGGVKLVAIGDSSFTIDYGGKTLKGNLDNGPQIAPHPDLTNWLIDYMNSLGKRIDAQNPDLTQSTVIRVNANGSAPSSLMKIEQANPFVALPEYLESVDFKVKLTPHKPTQVEFAGMKITPAVYSTLGRSPYESALTSTTTTNTSGAAAKQ